MQTFDRPIQDAGQLGEQLVGQCQIFSPVKAVDEAKNDKSRGNSTAGVGQAGEFIGDHEKADLHFTRPGFPIFAVGRDVVFTGDPQHALGDRMLIGFGAQSGIGDDGNLLADQRLQSEALAQAGEGR
jgi:hypothetical protein